MEKIWSQKKNKKTTRNDMEREKEKKNSKISEEARGAAGNGYTTHEGKDSDMNVITFTTLTVRKMYGHSLKGIH